MTTSTALADLTRDQLAGRIDHTLLRPEATAADIVELAGTANALRTAAACVSPSRVRLLAGLLDGPLPCAVIGFPSGAHHPHVLFEEAARAVADGAAELDMVVDLGAVKDGDWARVRAGIAAVRRACDESGRPAAVKVICESAALTAGELAEVCRSAVDTLRVGDFVKTSTGFHPAGGATVYAVALMAAAVHPAGLLVKASGGIRTLADARAMLAAGADRLGCSSTGAILDELPA